MEAQPGLSRKRRLRDAAFRGLPDPVAAIDSIGRVIDCNEAFAAAFDLLPSELRCFGARELKPQWRAESFARLLASQDGSRVAISHPEGERLFLVRMKAIESGRGGTALILRDITEKVRSEEFHARWRMELEARVAERRKALEAEILLREEAEAELRQAYESVHGSQREIMLTLAEVVESRSPETARHVFRVGEYTRILASARGLSEDHVGNLADAAPMHDVGKIVIPDAILDKPGRLDEAEMETMRRHTTAGYELLAKSDHALIRTAATIAHEHHEKWDGSGYPIGKAGAGISLSGRVVAICDVFDALSTVRPYKPAWETGRILDFFRDQAGKHFDPELVDLLFQNADKFLSIARRFPDGDAGGVADLAADLQRLVRPSQGGAREART